MKVTELVQFVAGKLPSGEDVTGITWNGRHVYGDETVMGEVYVALKAVGERNRLLDALKTVGAEIAGIDWSDPESAWTEHDEGLLVDTVLTAWRQRDVVAIAQAKDALRKTLERAAALGMAENAPGGRCMSFTDLQQMEHDIDKADPPFPLRKIATWLGWVQAAVAAATRIRPEEIADINREAFK